MSRGGAFGDSQFPRMSEHPADPRKWGADCDNCCLKHSTPVWGDGPKDAVVAFIGEAPGRDEVSVGVPFVGRSGQTFENWLGKHNLKRQQVFIDNAVMCFPPGGDMKLYLQSQRKQTKKLGQPWKEPVDCCRPRLFRALKIPQCAKCGKWMRGPDKMICVCKNARVSRAQILAARKGEVAPRVIVPMGNFAMQAWLGFDGITSHAGYVENMKERREKMMLSAAREKGVIGGKI